MKGRITTLVVKNLASTDKPFELVDYDLKGFLARVQPSGVITYYFTYRAGDGSKRRYWIGKHPGITAPAARKAAEKIAAQVIQGIDPQSIRKTSRAKRERSKFESLGGFIEHKYMGWAMTHQKRGVETLQLLESNFSQFYGRKLSDITAWDMQKWRAEKGKAGLKPSTINRRVTTLKAVLNKAVEWEVIHANPITNIKPIKIDSNARIRYLSQQEEASLRDALDQRELELREGRLSGNAWRDKRGYQTKPALLAKFVDHLKPMTLLNLNTGMRRGELFNLKWKDVDLVAKRITIEGQTSKSGQTRHIPLNTEAFSILQQWREQTTADFVFASPVTGKRFNNIKKAWEQLRGKAHLEDFRFHDLRHTFASKLVMAGVDLYTVKELMGHSTIQMTERYAHLAPEHKASAVEAISPKIVS
jgi:integrase